MVGTGCGKLGIVLVGKSMLSVLVQFFADGSGCFLCSRDNGNGDYLQKDVCLHAGPPRSFVVRAPDYTAGHCWPTPLPETPKHTQVNLVQPLVGSLLLSPGSWCIQGFVCALQESLFSLSCGSSAMNSCWPWNSDALGIPSPLAQSPGWEVCYGA